jgi:hypothetical protein
MKKTSEWTDELDLDNNENGLKRNLLKPEDQLENEYT